MSDKRYQVVSIVMQCAVVLMAAAILITMITVYSDGEQTPPAAESAPESQTSTVDNQTYSTANEAVSQGTEEESEAPAVMASPDHLYTIREYHDHIAVFLSGNDVPYLEIGVRVSDLPEADQALLAEGIYADSRAELISVLQDYHG